jgi:glucokinase
MNKSEVVLGIDIGGTTTAFGFIDNNGECLAEAVIPTHADQPASSLVKRIHELCLEEFAPFEPTHSLMGIGIGAPNANFYDGTVRTPPNLSWHGDVPIAELFRDSFGLPVAVTNDANAAAIGEMMFGAARGMRHFIVVTLGTGVGSGIIVNGEVLYGHDGYAGELGHTTVDPQGRLCGCGKQGCLEAYASAGGLCRTVLSLLADWNSESVLRSVPVNRLTSLMVHEAAESGDAVALEAFEVTGRILGMKLADAVAITSPEAIFLFGGMAGAGEILFKPTRESMEKHLLSTYRNRVKLLPSGLMNGNAAILGAAALIRHELDIDRNLT